MLTVWGGATSRTMRVHWMLHELGLDYEPKLIGSRTGATTTAEFLALNPKGKIPVLVDDTLELTESVAIVTYLGDRYAPESGLIPAPYTVERARYNEWACFVQMELDAHTLYVMRKHRDLAAEYGAAPAAVDTAIAGFHRQVGVAERHLREHQHLVGESFSAADLLLVTCLDWAVAYEIELTQPLLQYRSRIRKRPAYRAAAELNFSISPGA